MRQRNSQNTRYSLNGFLKNQIWIRRIRFATTPMLPCAVLFGRSYPYDETLTGLEDIAWAKRIENHGYKVVYNAAAEVIHLHDESPRRTYMRYRREAIALKQISPESHFGVWDFLQLFPTNVISDWFHAARENVLLGNLLGILVFRLMQFSGTYRGFAKQGAVTPSLKHKFYYPKPIKRGSCF